MKNRILAVLLALALCLALLPTSVFAVEDTSADASSVTSSAAENDEPSADAEEPVSDTGADASAPADPEAPEETADEPEASEPVADTPEEPAAPEAPASSEEPAETDADEPTEEDGIMPLAEGDPEEESGNLTDTTAELAEGVNVIRTGAENTTYNIGDGQVVMIEGTDTDSITFTNCTFNLSGKTVLISGNQSGVAYNRGETITKLFVGKNVTFNNCVFVSTNGEKISSAGYDACIYFFSGEIVLNGCTLSATDYQGQFLGLYGKNGSVTFNNSNISTVGNTGGWSYAMYGASVLKLNGSTMTATGMKQAAGGGNVNAFYSGDLSTNYDAISIKDSTINFSDNYGGGFAINRVNIYVDNSKIYVNNNAGNATNSGVWFVNNSTIQMNGNRTHGWSHISDTSVNSTIEILHNGYAGYYITADASFENCTVDIRCNGERYLSYSAGDVWLNAHTLTIKDCGHVWLGAVGRKGVVNASNSVVAYDLFENKTKGNTEAVLSSVTLDGQEKHVLFLNPDKDFDYARGDTEGEDGNSNDDDLFEDVEKETVIGKDTAKIGELTTAQLSHHIYDWENGEITDEASQEAYGVKRYACIECGSYISHTGEHPGSFNCAGTYVYAPLVGIVFDDNVRDDSVSNMPEGSLTLEYGETFAEPELVPTRISTSDDYTYEFTGWYVDKACTEAFDFETELKSNYTVVYAGWKKVPVGASLDWEISRSKTATELDDDYQSQVTLSLPSAEEQLVSDVVFVLDKSTSADLEKQALEMLQNLREQIAGTNAEVKVGVVIFNREANVTGFKNLATEYDAIEAAITQNISSGTNCEAGLLAAQQMLEDDTSVDDSRKYVIFVSDGITYMYGEEPTILNGYWLNDGSPYASADPYSWSFKYGSNNAPADWSAWLTKIGDLIEANEVEEISYDDRSTIAVGSSTEFARGDGDSLTSVDMALYRTYTAYQALASRYSCYAMTIGTTTSYSWGPSFMEYLSGGVAVDFSTIENDIVYLVDAGSTVEDYMGYVADDYNFDFVNEASAMTLTVGDASYNAVQIADNQYGFKPVGGGYAYTVTYEKGNLEDTEHFVWAINEPITNFAPVQLTYTVKLANPKAEAGTYGTYDADGGQGYEGLYTNNSATLYPVDTTGSKGEPQEFAKPTVSYTVKETPTEPTKPTEPTEPTKPTEPTQPTQPGQPGQPTQTPTQPTQPPQKTETTTPKTGDSSNLVLPIGLAAICVVALGVLIPLGKKRGYSGKREK